MNWAMTVDGGKEAEGNKKAKSSEVALTAISTSPSSKDWVGFWVGFVVYTAVCAILPLLLLHWHYASTSASGTPFWAIVVVLLVCAGGSLWYTFRLIDRQVWKLTMVELVAGSAGQTRYSLDSINKIVLGLPKQLTSKPGRKLDLEMRKGVDDYLLASTLVLIFKDGSILPLKIRFLNNGTRIVNELTTRMHNVVVKSYEFTEHEIELLRTAEPNRLIPAKKRGPAEKKLDPFMVTSKMELPPQIKPDKDKNKDKDKDKGKDKGKGDDKDKGNGTDKDVFK
jgi:hypothetical protein